LGAAFFFAATFRFGAALRFAVFRFAGLRPFAFGRDAFFFFLFAAMRVLRWIDGPVRRRESDVARFSMYRQSECR
jgi:hypothetical protein